MNNISTLSWNFEKMFKDVAITVAYKTKLNLEDQTESFGKSGISKVCFNDYSQKYCGHSQKAIKTRYGEHSAHIRFAKSEKSRVILVVLNSGHSFDLKL